ncbi:MAG TPA: endonuclease [Sphingobacteriaceae bacterium]|nr:endonuclease [Sphingobacteriaceae bacterium]
MRPYVYLFFILFSFSVNAQTVTICSWNIQNLGQSKNDKEMAFIANTVKSFDIIVIQEVVAGLSGPPAVARLVDQLNRTGAKWEYTISHGTSSSKGSKERYAFIWNAGRVKKTGEAWLEKKYNLLIDREPYFARFMVAGKAFTIAGFHAVPKSKQPETEIKYFKFLPALYPDDNLIFCGDFNTPQSHTVFNPLKSMGYLPVLAGQKTTLRQKCINGDCLASEYDNFFYNTLKFKCIQAGIVPFYKKFDDIMKARLISDHVPIYFKFSM